MMSLAIVYCERVRGDRAQNLEDAIAAYQQSLQVMTREAMPLEWAGLMNNLASVYAARIRGDRIQNLKNAVAACQQSLTIFKPNLLPNECRQTSRLLATLYDENHLWKDAVAPYKTAMEATEFLYQASLSRSSQEAELLATNDLFRRAAYAQARAGNLEQAVLAAEVGRARGLSETLERDRADLKALDKDAPNLCWQYQQAVDAQRQLEAEERAISSLTPDNRPSLSETELHRQAEIIHKNLSDAIAAIRQHPGYADFLAQPSFEDITVAVKPDQPLIYLLSTPNGSLALIIYQSEAAKSVEISSVWLDTLTETSLLELLFGPGDDLSGWFGAYSNQSADRKIWFETIDQVTCKLWETLIGPVVTHLQALNAAQATLIPMGFLGFLPLHAAWTNDPTTPSGRRYALDAVTFTYAPNARSLGVAREIARRTAVNSLLAINEPRPTTASPLPHSEREIEAAVAYFPQHHTLKYEQASRDAVLAALSHHDVLHFSCHGNANVSYPLDSGLLMAHGETLSLRDFFNLQLHGVRLAILSACETGLPSIELPDEIISLPIGLLQAGVAGIAASLWSVADLSTMMLLVRFYAYWRQDGLPPTQALCNAQQWVRDTSNDEKKSYFQGFLPELTSARMADGPAEHLYRAMVFADPEAKDFAHPFHWAAFTYVGA